MFFFVSRPFTSQNLLDSYGLTRKIVNEGLRALGKSLFKLKAKFPRVEGIRLMLILGGGEGRGGDK